MRLCETCGADISHKRKDARYCERACKVKASDARRSADGREAQRSKQRYATHGERMRSAARQNYAAKAEEKRQYSREYRKLHRDRRRAFDDKRRQRMLSNFGYVDFTYDEWVKLVNRFDGCCAYCGDRCDALEMDHVVPISRGGRHAIANILPACPTCNRSKSSRFLAAWRYKK